MSTEKKNKDKDNYKEPAPKLRVEEENPSERDKEDKKVKKQNPKE